MEETSEICQRIRESLLAFEREFSANVLFAGLTGSTAMGLSNQTSDSDIFVITEEPILDFSHKLVDKRFKYHSFNDYKLALKFGNFEQRQDSILLREDSLHLIVFALPAIESSKTIPVSYPSSHTYQDDKDRLPKSVTRLFYRQHIYDWRGYVQSHWEHLIEQHCKAIDVLDYLYPLCRTRTDTVLKKSQVVTREYLYAAHNILSMQWIIKNMSLSPNMFVDLLKTCNDKDVFNELMPLYEENKSSNIPRKEILIERNHIIENFVEKGLNEAKIAIEKFAFTDFQKKLL